MYKANSHFDSALLALEKAIDLCFANLYFSELLFFSQNILKRPDLSLSYCEKHFQKINFKHITESLLFIISNFLLGNKNYEACIQCCEIILHQLSHDDNNIYIFFTLSNLVNAKISSYQFTTEEDEEQLHNDLGKIKNGISQKYGEKSVYLAKSYYSNYSFLYKKKFTFLYNVLQHTTLYQNDKINQLTNIVDDKIFTEVNYNQPLWGMFRIRVYPATNLYSNFF